MFQSIEQVSDEMMALIPREVLFADPTKQLPKLSPDGKWISFLAPYDGILNVWLAPAEAIMQAKAITQSLTPIQSHDWSLCSEYVLYTHDTQGDENWRLYGYELATQKNKAYTPLKAKAKILKMSFNQIGKILIGLNSRYAPYYDVYELDLKTGRSDCIFENNLYWDFFADNDYHIKVGIQITPKDGAYFDLSSEEPTELIRVSHEDLLELYFYPRLKLDLSQDGHALFLTKTFNNTSELIEIDLRSKKVHSLGQDKKADVFDVLLDPQSKRPLAFASYYERKEWYGLTPEIARDLISLRQLDRGDIGILSQSPDNQIWIVSFIHDDGPTQYYSYSRKTQQASHLFASFQDEKHPFVKMHPKVITMEDGIQCVSYLSLPKEIDPQQNGEASHPVPLVLIVHGGPSYRDFWGFNASHQWLANRGYAVLSVNYRGSTGFGLKHTKAGYGEWAGKMHQDLLDAVQWAISEGITTANKVAIMGRSFGGYATLVGLSMTPDVFNCGIDLVGPANLHTMLKHLPPHWKLMQVLINEMIGCDPNTEEGQRYLAKRSPYFYAHAIKKPVLIGHGANDAKIMQSESDQMVQVLQENHIPVTYVVFPDEGHALLCPHNRMAFYELVESFLAKNLGGKCEAHQTDLQSRMVVKVDDFQLSTRSR